MKGINERLRKAVAASCCLIGLILVLCEPCDGLDQTAWLLTIIFTKAAGLALLAAASRMVMRLVDIEDKSDKMI